jgi:hypothetical protein
MQPWELASDVLRGRFVGEWPGSGSDALLLLILLELGALIIVAPAKVEVIYRLMKREDRAAMSKHAREACS